MDNAVKRITNLYTSFAEKSQRIIAHPAHFTIFLFCLGMWFVWSMARRFDTFSALVGNDITTYAEYAFAILTLAAALSASDKTQQIIEHLTKQQDRIEKLEKHVARVVDAIANKEGIEND